MPPLIPSATAVARRAAGGSGAALGPVVAVAAWKRKWRLWARKQASGEVERATPASTASGRSFASGAFPG
eukprot:12110476-Alexandrium_andersonii.AAC.1